MSVKGSRKYPHIDAEPLKVDPLTTAGPQPWHQDAFELRTAGCTMRAIARELGIGFGSVQRLLNPDSKERQMARKVKYERQRRLVDKRYAEKRRTYSRQYMQYRSVGEELK